MKRFLAISLLCLIVGTYALACADFGRTHNSYMFSVFRREGLQDPFAGRLTDYWLSYLKGTPAETDYWYQWDGEAVLKAAKHKKDTEMQAYAELFSRYMQVVEVVKQDSWDYPTRQQLQQRRSTLLSVLSKAKAYSGQKLRSQYALLVMRANMMLGLDNQNKAYWIATGQKMPASVWRDAMRNIYARALLRAGQRKQACDIYAEQGDMQSIKWAMRKYRNLAGIKSMYASDPDSPTLTYLIQDFVNNAQETLDVKPETVDDNSWIETVGAKTVLKDEVQGFITFADGVLKEGRVKNPCLWRTAQGMLHYLFGQQKEAMAALDEALGMTGTPRMKDNARTIRLLASTRSNVPGAAYSDYLVKEMTWLDKKIIEERGTMNTYCNHYTDVKERIVHRGLIPLYNKSGLKNTAIMLYGMMNKDEADFNEDTAERNNANYSAWNEYYQQLDSLSPDALAHYYEYLTTTKTDAFESYVSQRVYQKADYYNDLIGTKLMACGRFDEAIPYLKKVSIDFVNAQDISYYMSQRKFNVERWFHRQFIKGDEFLGPDRDKPWPKMQESMKLTFCRTISELQHSYVLCGDEELRRQQEYQLATLYCQASHFGDCWFLTHYGKSVNDSARVGELDFVAETVQCLNQSKLSSDVQLRYKSLYALALMPDDPWFTEDYDADYNLVTTLRPQSRQFKALAALSDFALANPQAVDRYTTKCDVLRQFRAAVKK